jgi:anti-sigma factor RsiW
MTCENVGPELLAFHLGAIDPASREAVEGHLVTCPECLRSYLALKRGLEENDEAPAPSPAARERLRRAVLAELAAPRSMRWRWWERPLAFGLAATAALIALSAVRTVSSGPGAAPRTLGQPTADPGEHRG